MESGKEQEGQVSHLKKKKKEQWGGWWDCTLLSSPSHSFPFHGTQRNSFCPAPGIDEEAAHGQRGSARGL